MKAFIYLQWFKSYDEGKSARMVAPRSLGKEL